MPATYEPIATTTLGSTATTVSFTSIPGTYTDLVLVTSIKATSADTNQFMRFNSDSGSNYSHTNVYGTGTSALSFQQSSQDKINSVLSGYLVTSQNSPGIYNIMNYSNTTTFKTMISRFNNSSVIAQAEVSLYRSTSAITAIEIFTTPDSFAVGSTLTLYGIKAA
jgi:hypothetical protein